MSGYMVTTDGGDGFRSFYMVNADDPDRARGAVNQLMGRGDAEALAPVPDATIDQYRLQPGQAWLCTTIGPNGEVTHSQLK
jgi:hypothetical protein